MRRMVVDELPGGLSNIVGSTHADSMIVTGPDAITTPTMSTGCTTAALAEGDAAVWKQSCEDCEVVD
jgi:hypothetical protein